MSFSARFNHFLGQFTYRQRLVFFALVFFSFVPPSTYFIMGVMNYHLQLVERLIFHTQIHKKIGEVINPSLQYELLLQQDSTTNREVLNALNEEVKEGFVALKETARKGPNFEVKSLGPGFSDSAYAAVDTKDWELVWDDFSRDWSRLSAEERRVQIGLINRQAERYIAKAWKQFNFYGAETLSVYQWSQIVTYQIPLMQLKVVEYYSNHNADSFRYHRDKFNEALDEALGEYLQSNRVKKYQVEELKGWKETLKESYELLLKDSNRASFPYEIAVEAVQAGYKTQHEILGLMEEVLVHRRNMIFAMWYILVTSLVVGTSLVFVYVIRRVLTTHLKTMTEHLRELAAGNFKLCFCADNKDEFGQVGRAFDDMVRAIEQITREFQDLGRKFTETTLRLAENARDQEFNIKTQEVEIAKIEQNAQDVLGKHKLLVERTESYNLGALQLKTMEQAKGSLELLQTNMNQFVYSAKGIIGVLEEVGQKVSDMNCWTVFMSKVSDSANMLSLNSSIETASVEKDQELFAAISSKIQRFALNTAESAGTIKHVVSQMSGNVTDVEHQALACVTEIDEGSVKLAQVRQQLDHMTRQSHEEVEKAHSFTLKVQQQMQQLTQMFGSISNLQLSAQKNTEMIGDLKKALEELGGTAISLHKTLETFEKIKFFGR